MNRYLDAEAWRVVEKGFNPDNMRSSESMFSIGNGRFGQRATPRRKIRKHCERAV